VKEFWKYSSRNRKFHEWHPRTSVLREAIVLHWEKGWTQDAIAFRFDIHIDTVNSHLRRARRNGDPRAAVRHAATLKAMNCMEMAK